MVPTSSWIQTYSGKQMWPLEPRVEDICIEDIAHSLSMQCRFTGHSKFFYSVSQHSVHVSYLVPPEYALWGLLHDAPEAYVTDMSRPVKRGTKLGEEYKIVEDRIMKVICEKFNLPLEEPKEVKVADNIMVVTEKRDLLNGWNKLPKWQETEKPMKERIVPFIWQQAERFFLDRYYELTKVN